MISKIKCNTVSIPIVEQYWDSEVKMSNSIHEDLSLSSSLRDRINDSNKAYSRQNSILSQSTVANSDGPAHLNGHHQVGVSFWQVLSYIAIKSYTDYKLGYQTSNFDK